MSSSVRLLRNPLHGMYRDLIVLTPGMYRDLIVLTPKNPGNSVEITVECWQEQK